MPRPAPQVGGKPLWIQYPERVFCKLCNAEMVFVAALAPSNEFEVYVLVNNDGGCQYHFACSACRTITTFGQHT
jgi:hypothetical protein